MSSKLTVLVSAGQSRNPQKRELEDAVANALAQREGLGVVTIPHLYDLTAGSETIQQLKEIDGPLIVISWLYERAAHWILDRNGISGMSKPSTTRT